MTTERGIGGGDDIRRLTALVEEQASRLVSLEHQLAGPGSKRRFAGWPRAAIVLAVAGSLVVSVAASASAAPRKPLTIGAGGVLTACYGTKTTVKFLPAPVRILDTRDGTGTTVGTRPAGATTSVQTNGLIPGALAVIGNVTVTNGQSGYLTVWPGGTRPNASTINFSPGWNIANHVQSGLAQDGTFQIYNAVPADIIFDATAGIYPVSNGLRLIDAAENCAADEVKTTWNQQGPPGLSSIERVHGSGQSPAAGQTLTDVATCTGGRRIIAGGYQASSGSAIASSPNGTTGWAATVTAGSQSVFFYAIALCAFAN